MNFNHTWSHFTYEYDTNIHVYEYDTNGKYGSNYGLNLEPSHLFSNNVT